MTQLEQFSNILGILSSPWTWVGAGIMLLAAYWAWDSRTKEMVELLKEIRWNSRYKPEANTEPSGKPVTMPTPEKNQY